MEDMVELDAALTGEVTGGKSLGFDPNGGDVNGAVDQGAMIDPNG